VIDALFRSLPALAAFPRHGQAQTA
jgi:hypothetical protein